MGNENLDKPVKWLEDIHEAAKLPRALMTGTQGMRDKGTQYLPKWPKEDDEAWRARRDSSFLFSAYAQTWKSLVGRVFRTPVQLAEDVPEELVQWAENINASGLSLTNFARHVLGDAIHSGWGWLIADFPVTKKQLTRAQEQRLGLRPYARYIQAENMLELRTVRWNGRDFVTYVRTLEEEMIPDGNHGEKLQRRVRIYEQEPDEPNPRFSLWEKPPNGNEWEQIDEGVMRPIQRIPIRELRLTDSGDPFLGGLAWKNLQHWQVASDLSVAQHTACVVAYVADFPKDAEGYSLTSIGHGTVIHIPKGAKFEYLIFQSDGPSVGERAVEQIKKEMQILALEPVLERPGNITATASAIDRDQANSAAAGAVVALGDALEALLQSMAEWVGIAGDSEGGIRNEGAGGSVIMPQDFGIDLEEAATLSDMLKARQAGEISRETFLGYLRDNHLEDLIIEDEIARLQGEAEPSLGATGQLRGALRQALAGKLEAGEIEDVLDAVTDGEAE